MKPVVVSPIPMHHPVLGHLDAVQRLRDMGVQILDYPNDGDLHEEYLERILLIDAIASRVGYDIDIIDITRPQPSRAELEHHVGRTLVGNPTMNSGWGIVHDSNLSLHTNKYLSTKTFAKYANRKHTLMSYNIDDLKSFRYRHEGNDAWSSYKETVDMIAPPYFIKNVQGKGATHRANDTAELAMYMHDMGGLTFVVEASVQEYVPITHETRYFVVGGEVVTHSPRLLCLHPHYDDGMRTAESVRDMFIVDFDNGQLTASDLVYDTDLREQMDAFAEQVAKDFIDETGATFFVVDVGLINGELGVVEFNSFTRAGMYACDVDAIADAFVANINKAPKLALVDAGLYHCKVEDRVANRVAEHVDETVGMGMSIESLRRALS